MKVSYRIPPSSTYVPIFDQAAGASVIMPDFKVSVRFNSNKSQGFGSVSQSITPMGNAIVTLSWKFGITYADLATATAAIRTMQALGEQLLHIQVIQDGETQYYPNGTVENYDGEQTGAYVLHSITFVQQLVTSTPP